MAALGEIGSRAAVRCLVDMLSREDESFHRDVVIALRKIAALVRGAMWTRIPPEEQARRVAAIIRNARKRVRGRIKRMMVTPHKTARAA